MRKEPPPPWGKLWSRDVSGRDGLDWVRADTLRGQSQCAWPGGVLEAAPRPLMALVKAKPVTGSAEHGDMVSQLAGMEDPGPVSVIMDGQTVRVYVDPDKGPRWGLQEADWVNLRTMRNLNMRRAAKWEGLTMDEKQLCLITMAKKILFLQSQGHVFLSAEGDGAELEPEVEKTREELEAETREAIERRCWMESLKEPIAWNTITTDTVTTGHRQKGRGMFYGLEFPWTEQMLHDWGPDWVTQAFRASGILDKETSVTKVFQERRTKITTGNNGGKFFFEVKYSKKRINLDTRFFCKVPFPLEGKTRSDRLSSSVNKQPQEMYEINTSRLLESKLPVKTPRYYFGDISNETTNWILITERINFGDDEPQNFGKPAKKRKGPLPQNVIEGPYDKCMDHNLRGDPKEYYMKLITTGAMIAGKYKAGQLGDKEALSVHFADLSGRPAAAWGLAVNLPSGEDPRTVKPKLDTAQSFLQDQGKVVFPKFVTEEWCSGKLRNLMLSINAYSGELQYWKHLSDDYVALTHQNMNVDNAYFWRDEDDQLQIGVFDWGNMGATAVGQKLWWWVYCSDYEVFRDNAASFVEAFCDSYHASGGPQLDKDQLHMMVIISALEQMLSLMFAVPQIHKMVKKDEWSTIEDRYDYRIAENIDGKSTLRLYLHVLSSIMRIIEELEADKTFQQWVDVVWGQQFGLPPKSQDVIMGLVRMGPGL